MTWNPIVAGYGACYEFTLIDGTTPIFESNLQPWITSFFVLSLTTNVLATCEYSVLSRRRRVEVSHRIRTAAAYTILA